MGAGVAVYLDHLRELPFVEDARVVPPAGPLADGVLELETPAGPYRAFLAQKTSNLSHATAAQTVANIERAPGAATRWMVFAPRIGPGIGARLREAGIDYVDQAGNCNVTVGDRYIARIEGRRSPRPKPGRRGIGAAGYRALFALLATPGLLTESVRTIATHAGVNRQTVAEIIERLGADGLVVAGQRRSWVAGKRHQALEQWLAGYVGTVRPKLWLGAYRSTDKNPDELRRRIVPLLDELAPPWRWGGEWAGYLLNRHFRGARTVVHVSEDSLSPAFSQKLRVAPDDDGPLVILGVPGPEALKSPHPETVHPLLVWSELMASGSERAREAAEEPMQLEEAAGLRLVEYESELEP